MGIRPQVKASNRFGPEILLRLKFVERRSAAESSPLQKLTLICGNDALQLFTPAVKTVLKNLKMPCSLGNRPVNYRVFLVELRWMCGRRSTWRMQRLISEDSLLGHSEARVHVKRCAPHARRQPDLTHALPPAPPPTDGGSARCYQMYNRRVGRARRRRAGLNLI